MDSFIQVTKLIEIIDKRVRIALQNIKHDKTVFGKVKSIATTSAVVTIDEVDRTCGIKDGISIAVGNVVIVKYPCNNRNRAYISGKLK